MSRRISAAPAGVHAGVLSPVQERKPKRNIMTAEELAAMSPGERVAYDDRRLPGESETKQKYNSRHFVTPQCVASRVYNTQLLIFDCRHQRLWCTQNKQRQRSQAL
jgi:hypothetical protein